MYAMEHYLHNNHAGHPSTPCHHGEIWHSFWGAGSGVTGLEGREEPNHMSRCTDWAEAKHLIN